MSKKNRNLIKKRKVHFVRLCFIIIFLVVIGYSLYQILDTNNNYVKEQRVREQMMQFKPVVKNISIADINLEDDKVAILNQSIVDAKELNSDVVGWLTLDNTRIDYPFVKTADNDFYLHTDINKIYSYAGTVFMDYKCDSHFSDFSSIIYGHNMKNGTMFSDIRRYDNSEFFNNNQTGKLFLVDATFNIEIFAYMLVNSDDNMVYSVGYTDSSAKQMLLTYIAQNAMRYRDLSLTADDKLLVLSTCTNNLDDDRSVLIARLVKIQ